MDENEELAREIGYAATRRTARDFIADAGLLILKRDYLF